MPAKPAAGLAVQGVIFNDHRVLRIVAELDSHREVLGGGNIRTIKVRGAYRIIIPIIIIIFMVLITILQSR